MVSRASDSPAKQRLMLLKLLLLHLLALLVLLQCLRTVPMLSLYTSNPLLILSSVILTLHHAIGLIPIINLLLLHVVILLLLVLLSHLLKHVVIGVLAHAIQLVFVFVLRLLLLRLVLHALLAICASSSCHVSTVVFFTTVLIFWHVLLSLIPRIRHLLLLIAVLALKLLLLHLLNLLLERLLHVQTQPRNNLLLLINVFHIEEVFNRLVIVQQQVLLQGV